MFHSLRADGERSIRINLEGCKNSLRPNRNTDRGKLARQWGCHVLTAPPGGALIDRAVVSLQLLVGKLVDESLALRLKRSSAFSQMEVSETGQL